MGLNVHAIRFLLEARARGVSFENVATIGRQGLHIDSELLRQTLAAHGVDVSETESSRLLEEADGFSEPILRLLGASVTCSIDVSPYQDVSVLHDMNEALPETLKERFSVVIDGGSLEHVFNFPRAIANCMEMVRPEGHFVGISPANNFMGHGFYQFSPELYFRVFSPANGFDMQRMVIYQDCWPDDHWHEVRDPEQVGRRVTLVNRYPTYLLVQAQKHESVSLFAPVPQQSDYLTLWKDSAAGGFQFPASAASGRASIGWRSTLLPRARTAATKLVPAPLKRRYHRFKTGGNPFNPDLYRQIDR